MNNLAAGTGSIDVQVCFVAGTPIRLKNGEVVKIEDLKKGLFSRAAMHDNPTGEIDDFEIIELYENETDHLVEITFENVKTGSRFSTKSTPEHPFFVYEKGWTAAKDIQFDDECRSAASNKIKVVSVLHLEEHCKVYNFQVKSAHTYFVGETDEESVLVHNDCTGMCEFGEWCGDFRHTYAQIGRGVVKIVSIPTAAVGRGIKATERNLWQVSIPYGPSLSDCRDSEVSATVGTVW